VGLSLAAPVVLSLLAAASGDLEASLRTEGRSSTLALDGAPARTRSSAVVQGRGAAVADLGALHLAAEYAPRIWSSDLAASPSPLVDHQLAARIETARPGPWRADAGALATRGRTDPLADPVAAAATGTTQLPTASPVSYEALRATARVDRRLDPRTTLDAGGGWAISRGQDAAARQLLPDQRTARASAGATYLVDPRDTLRLLAEGSGTLTAAGGGDTRTVTTALSGSWRRLLSPSTVGWLGAGGSMTRATGAAAQPARILPVAQAGWAATWEPRLALETSARMEPALDRYTGAPHPMATGSLGLRWRATSTVALAASGSAGSRIDGETAVATLDARATWTLRDRVDLELGTVWRWNHERRPELPSFVEGGIVAAISWASAPARRARAAPAN
jgi:hypothetical protein